MQQRSAGNSKGVDVSHWQGKVDWEKVKSAGYDFAILKASEGSAYVDDTVYDNFNGAKESGLAVGLYHFFRASTAAAAAQEAAWFGSIYEACGGPNGVDFPPILDIESAVAGDKGTVTSLCLNWLTSIESKYKVKPMVYTFPSFIDNWLTNGLANYPLWYANYGDTLNVDRGGWSEWTILQHTDKGTVPGISGYVDLNELNGRIEDYVGYKLTQDAADSFIIYCKHMYYVSMSEQDKAKWAARAKEARLAAGFAEDYEPAGYA